MKNSSRVVYVRFRVLDACPRCGGETEVTLECKDKIHSQWAGIVCAHCGLYLPDIDYQRVKDLMKPLFSKME